MKISRRGVVFSVAAMAAAAMFIVPGASALRRYSVHPGDQGYENWLRGRMDGVVHEVTLDGARVSHVVMADERQGYLEKYVVDKNNEPVMHGDMFLMETKRGEVRVRLVKQ